MEDIHSKGQYFTKNGYLKQSVYDLILNKPSRILEPSSGRGDLVDFVLEKGTNIDFDLYEIDETIPILDTVSNHKVNYGDFLSMNVNRKYDTIIGNPPYVKTKTGNLYLDFIVKCYKLLNTDGELIFIVPSDFIKLTRSCKIINEMMENGTFTHIIHPHDESLFENASIDVIVFRYCKNSELEKTILVNNEEKFLININGILTFTDTQVSDTKTLSDYFDIYVGMVTGKENVFKNDTHGNIKLLNGKDKIDKYIMLDTFPTDNESLNEYMLSNKETLQSRKIRKFTEKNWFEWGAPRNYENIKNNLGKPCIYVSNITRSKTVCFEDKVQFFGGGLIMMVPKKRISLKKIVKYLNSDEFKSNYLYAGRFKIGHKQLCNCLI